MDEKQPSPTPKDGKPGDFFPLLYKGTRAALRFIYTVNGGITVIGHENIPLTGPAIIAPNHVSMADPPLIAVALKRPVTIMAKEELFKVPVIGPYITHLGAFSVTRGTADRVALRMALNHLALGRLLLIFPEGTRGDGLTLQEPERGLGMLARMSGAPVIPTFISGTSTMLPRGKAGIYRAHVGVQFGKQIDPKEFTGKGAGDELAKRVMEKIEEMRPAASK